MFEVEIRDEKRRYMYWLARIFGKKITTNLYEWRGKLWICGEVPSPFDKDDL